MKVDDAYLIGLRLSPERGEPDQFTLWFEDAAGQNRVPRRDGRLQWAATPSAARRLADDEYDLAGAAAAAAEEVSVCSVPGLLYALTNPSDGDDRTVTLALNLLDDLVNCTPTPLPPAAQRSLDMMVKTLTEGDDLRAGLGPAGSGAAVEAVFASLGRVLCFSDLNVGLTAAPQ